MNTPLLVNEAVIKESLANLKRGVEFVGGKLFLTNQRLVFESHSLNIQTGVTVINVSNIKSSKQSWPKFLGLTLFRNGLDVELTDGDIFQFVVYSNGKWKDAIGK